MSKDLRLKLYIYTHYGLKKHWPNPQQLEHSTKRPYFWMHLKLGFKPVLKTNEKIILWKWKPNSSEAKGGCGKKRKATSLVTAANLYNWLWKKTETFLATKDAAKSRLSKLLRTGNAWINPPPNLGRCMTSGFQRFPKIYKTQKTLSSFAKTHRPFVYITFSLFYMLEIKRPLMALIRLNIGESKWEAAQWILSWNLLSHLFSKCKYGLSPAFPVRMTLAEGGWYGSHFPSRCSSYFPQTQQRHKISLTSDSEKVDNHFFVLLSSLGKAAVHYTIMSKIIPIRLRYEYWNISLICAQHWSLNMPIVFTVSITYFKWHGKIIYVNITSAEAEWCLAKLERLSDLPGPRFQGKERQGTLSGDGWWLRKGVRWIGQWVLLH